MQIFRGNTYQIGDTMTYLRDAVGVSELESLATVAFVLMSLGPPFFTPCLRAGRSTCKTSKWTVQTTYDLLLKISLPAVALISNYQCLTVAEIFFEARATIMLSQVPEEGRATKHAKCSVSLRARNF